MESTWKKLVVGTANFGLAYGKKQSRICNLDAKKVIRDVLHSENIYIETGSSYYGVEELIGNALGATVFNRIILKISPEFYSSKDSFLKSVKVSLSNLKQNNVYAIMLHGLGDSLFESSNSVRSALRSVVESGLSEKIGVSCYNISEVFAAKNTFPDMEIFQLPENIVDRRSYDSKELMQMYHSGVIFQVRSIFLQGLLIGENTGLPKEFDELIKIKTELEHLAKSNNMDSIELCLRYAQSIEWASHIVLGFENYQQFRKNLACIESASPKISFNVKQGSNFLVDPRNWS